MSASMDMLDTAQRITNGLWISIVHSIILGILIWLIAIGRVSLICLIFAVYPLTVILMFTIFRKSRFDNENPKDTPRVSLGLVLGAVAFTVAAVVAIGYWFIQPSFYLTVQSGTGIFLATYCWFLVYKVSKLSI